MLKEIASLSVVSVLSRIGIFLVSPFLISQFGLEWFGNYGLVLSFVLFAEKFITALFNNALARYYHLWEESDFTLNFNLFLSLSIVISFVFSFLSYFLYKEIELAVLVLSLPIFSFSESRLRYSLRFKRLALSQFLRNLVVTLGLVACACNQISSPWIAWLLGNVIFVMTSGKYLENFDFGLRGWTETSVESLNYALPLFISGLAATGMTFIERVVLEDRFDSRLLGVAVFSLQIASIFNLAIANPLKQVIMPIIFRDSTVTFYSKRFLIGIFLIICSFAFFKMGVFISNYFVLDTMFSINSIYAFGFIWYYFLQLIHTVYKAELLLNKKSKYFLLSQFIFIVIWITSIVYFKVNIEEIPFIYGSAFLLSSLMWRVHTKNKILAIISLFIELIALILLWFL